MTKLKNICFEQDWCGNRYSCDVVTDDKEVVAFLAAKDGGVTVYPELNYPFDFLVKKVPEIKKVIFNDPATIVYWEDKTKTLVKANAKYGDKFNPELGLAMAICKKAMGNKGNFNEVFKKWIPEY